MTTIKCPICEQPITGRGDYGLTRELRYHFENVHNIVTVDVSALRGGMGSPRSTEEEYHAIRYGSPAQRSSSGAYGDDLTERDQDLYGVEGPPDTRVVERRAGKLVLECPMCGFEILGKDGDELSNNLRRHLEENNEVELPRASRPRPGR